jgi:hypothetical protein
MEMDDELERIRRNKGAGLRIRKSLGEEYFAQTAEPAKNK